jgi:FkbM family methyltransferase
MPTPSNTLQTTPPPGALTRINAEAPIKIVDIGANPVDGAPPYKRLLSDPLVQVVGFEPQQEELDTLNKAKGANETYLPLVIGDGKAHTLHICTASGMTSLLKPNVPVLELFHGFAQWAKVTRTEKVKTVRLDDVPETEGMDYLKIDIQGAELMVLENAKKRLKRAVVIHTEVEFLPLYTNQPLFADVAQFLQTQGFMLHRLQPMVSRSLKPVLVRDNAYAGLSQHVWADAIFIRDIVDLEPMDSPQLLTMATILHNCYQSIDVVLRLMTEYDARENTQFAEVYKKLITGQLQKQKTTTAKRA